MNGTEQAVEDQVAAWRAYVDRRPEVSGPDADELEDHLRSRITDLLEAGLDPDEAFLVAVKRIGSLDALTHEFAREHSDRLWKQLVLTGEAAPGGGAERRPVLVMLGFAIAGALLLKVPQLFGVGFSSDADVAFYLRNAGLFALAPLAAYLGWRRALGSPAVAAVAGLFVLAVVGANAYPLDVDSASLVLTCLHLPIALWLTVGIAYTGGDWRSVPRRMDFLRFSGEWFIYYVLIALGGGVLSGLVLGTFHAAGLDAFGFVSQWLVPCGAVGAVVVAAWLVEEKKSVVENMAPVLTLLFTPLFVLALLALLPALLWAGIDVDRDILIVFDLLLVVVLGLFLYGISAREPAAPPGLHDRLRLALAVVALLVDLVVLVALVSRIGEFGFSANKTAALGENLILLTNLAGSAWLLAGLLRGRRRFAALESWQTGFLGVYAGWAWTVVLLFPLVFAFA